LWEFDFGFRDYAPCPGYRYGPSFVSWVDERGHVAWCVPVPEAERQRRFGTAAVDHHRAAPWQRPISPWKLAGARVLLVSSAALFRFDVATGAFVDSVPFQRDDPSFPPYDGATGTFLVADQRCSFSSGPNLVVEACGDRWMVFSPRGVAVAVDRATGDIVETLRLTRAHIQHTTGLRSTARRQGKSFGITVETQLYLQ
jgi:hypothetical protein